MPANDCSHILPLIPQTIDHDNHAALAWLARARHHIFEFAGSGDGVGPAH
jgi:hypothetical protein